MKKSIIFLIAFVFFFAQCKKTDEILLKPEDASGLQVQQNEKQFLTLSMEEVLKDISFCEILNSLGNIKGEKLHLKSGDAETEIKVNWNKVNKFKKGDYESFTFLVDEADENIFSNLLFELNGKEKKILKLDYIPDVVWLKNQAAGLISPFGGRVIINEIHQQQLNLKSVICFQVEVIMGNQCPNPSCDNPYGCIFGPHGPDSYFTTYCYSNPSNSGGSTLGGSEITQSPGSGNTSSYTNVVNPYLNTALYNAIVETEALLGVEIDELPENPPYLIDHRTYLTQGQLVSADPYGGFTFYCKGKYLYVRGDEYWVDITGLGDWYKAKLVTNKLSVELTNLMGRGIWEMAEILGRYALPVEDLCIILTGSDFDGLESNRYLAGSFLLLEVIPGSKVLKPVANTIGDAIKYFFKYENELLDLVRVNGVVKFTDGTIQKLAAKATKNGDKTLVMLGKEDFENSIPYFERAGNIYKYYRFDSTWWQDLFILINFDVEEMWQINRQFLDNCKANGNMFFLSHDPYDARIRTGFYKKELDYIEQTLGGKIEKISDNLWKVVF